MCQFTSGVETRDVFENKSNYFIVRPKVDQRAGLLSLPHLGIFAIHMRYFCFVFKLN